MQPYLMGLKTEPKEIGRVWIFKGLSTGIWKVDSEINMERIQDLNSGNNRKCVLTRRL